MDDVNERLKEDWKEETSPFERVKTVVTTTYEGESAAEIAADALVSKPQLGNISRISSNMALL